jgi:predicted phage tail protein
MVPSGTTGITEPRFTTNVYFSKATDVYKVLKDLSTVFRGMLYWLDGNIFPILDEPKDPVYNFSAGNVINGQFGYESSGSKTMSNQVVVSWVNPLQDYKQEALIVEDKENKLLQHLEPLLRVKLYGMADGNYGQQRTKLK